MDAAVTLAYSGALLILVVLIMLSRRARTHGGSLRAGVMGAMYELQNQEKQQAVDVIVEGKAAATDPEVADGDLPQLEHPRQRSGSTRD